MVFINKKVISQPHVKRFPDQRHDQGSKLASSDRFQLPLFIHAGRLRAITQILLIVRGVTVV
jgi:hypothetical protein